jgi:hypothetical protein
MRVWQEGGQEGGQVPEQYLSDVTGPCIRNSLRVSVIKEESGWAGPGELPSIMRKGGTKRKNE